MSSTFRNVFAITIFTILLSNLAKAQPKTGEFIDASLGLGLSAPYDDSNIMGSGFYAQGEYVYGISKWFGLRPYAGVVITSTDNSNQQNQPDYKGNI